MDKLFFKSLIAACIFANLMAYTVSFANEDSAWQAFRDGKAVAVMRHGYAPVDEDNSALTRKACRDERNLSEEGREQATYIGQAIRAKGIGNANVYSSSMCRCLDTAKLLEFSDPVLLPSIDTVSRIKDDKVKVQQQTDKLKAWIKQAIETQGTPNILVTHGFNISTMADEFIDEGDFLLIGLDGDELVTLSYVSAEQL